ncbi:hypothetical protein BDD43_3503 [Mucilaginibacter gracilis]|uniref:Uncharacterized protein n=1 Tax=Mucilaginibacter gracilis TaxID=423350 RepID=A0A495J4J2_9SPHI|nr:hypothetical protein BDD43_3503 [Mucilaginibacter gracilis]
MQKSHENSMTGTACTDSMTNNLRNRLIQFEAALNNSNQLLKVILSHPLTPTEQKSAIIQRVVINNFALGRKDLIHE